MARSTTRTPASAPAASSSRLRRRRGLRGAALDGLEVGQDGGAVGVGRAGREAHPARRRGHGGGQAGLPHGAVARVVHLGDQAALDGVRLADPLGGGPGHGHLGAGLRAEVLPVPGRAGGEQRRDPVAGVGGVEPAVGAGRGQELLRPLAARVEVDPPAVRARVQAEQAQACAAEGDAFLGWQLRGPVAERHEHGVEQRDLQALAPVQVAARAQRGGDAGRGQERGEARGDGHGAEHRRGRGGGRLLAGPGQRAVGGGRGADHALPAGPPGPRVVGGEAGHGAVDHAGAGGQDRVRAEAEAVHHARPEVLQDDVGGAGQPPGQGQAGRVLEVDDDGPLAAVPGGVGRGVPPRAAGRVDADDLRALVGQQHPGQRAGDVLAEVDNADAGQGASLLSSQGRKPLCCRSLSSLRILRPVRGLSPGSPAGVRAPAQVKAVACGHGEFRRRGRGGARAAAR